MYDATREERAWIDLHIEIADAHAQTTAISPVIGKCNHFVLAFQHQILISLNAFTYTFLMISERPKRDRKPKVIWEAVESPSTASQ
jgi:hypothetical protein